MCWKQRVVPRGAGRINGEEQIPRLNAERHKAPSYLIEPPSPFREPSSNTTRRLAKLVFCGASILATGTASADACVLYGPRYALSTDTVNWSMRVGSGQNCTRGLRFNNMIIDRIELVSPPRSGRLTLQGPGISYRAQPDFEGQDSFDVRVSGMLNRIPGSSTIHIEVSVGAAGQPSMPTAIQKPPRRPPDVATPTPSFAPASGSLPGCPIWDWSKGAPPPMRAPFDVSKLYCPPPPFSPPGQPIGCACPP
jgi:hypothetical protein